jgi:hypothetical protein
LPGRRRTAARACDPLPEITEQAAPAVTAARYTAIRATLGVQSVPLLYRALAAEPGCLAWAWAVLAPLAACGVLEEVGRAVVSTLPAAPPAPPRAACRLAGLDDAAADQAGLVVAAFNRANPLNLAALAVLLGARRTGQAPAATAPPRMKAPPPHALAMPRTETLSADTVALMHFLAGHGGRRRVAAMPTLWSVLAANPAALALAAAALAPGFANGTIAAAARALSRQAERAVSALPMAPVPRLDRAAVLHLQRIAPFFAETIPAMIVIGAQLEPLFAREVLP